MEQTAKQILEWGLQIVEYHAGSGTKFSESAREWWATFFLPSAQRLESHPRFHESVRPDLERKLAAIGALLQGVGDVGADQMDAARVNMMQVMGRTILCDPPPKK